MPVQKITVYNNALKIIDINLTEIRLLFYIVYRNKKLKYHYYTYVDAS